MNQFELRALEVHSNLVWNFDHLRRVIDFMKRQELNTLILHRNDLVDLIVYPGVFFGASRDCKNIFERYQQTFEKLYKYTPTRRSGPYQRRDMLKRIFEITERAGIELMFENKELYFPDVLLELYPELTQSGAICPNQPLWFDFLETKYTELFQEFPTLKGMITSPGTGESRVAISSNRCICELCASTTSKDWYLKLINSMHRPIKAAGGILAIRDFVFDRKSQTELAAAFEEMPTDIVISLKNTPHDFYPTFPNNPRIGDVGDHAQWVEFDTMGQYFGWGVAPAIIADDYRRRMQFVASQGATGIILRTDWESLDGHTVFHNLNIVNLYAGAALARGSDSPNSQFYADWLCQEGMIKPGSSSNAIDEAAAWAEAFLATSWDIVASALFVNQCVFSDSSNYPVSLDHAWWLAEHKNSLKDWMPSKADALSTIQINVDSILDEKNRAVALAEKVMPLLGSCPQALKDTAHARIQSEMDACLLYVRGWEVVGRACILTRQALDFEGSGLVRQRSARLFKALADLLTIADEMREHRKSTDLHFVVYVAMGWERLEALHQDLSQRLEMDQLGRRSAATG